MAQIVDVTEAQALIAQGGVDLVDVREEGEWARGHLPGARNVPLDDLVADVATTLPRDGVLLVCARGIRSQTAARAAEMGGRADVYTLDGGTVAWEAAGLPIEKLPSSVVPALVTEPQPDVCGLPEPGLDAVVGENLRLLRTQRDLSLDALARVTGLSRTVLGQIELGCASPSVSVVWKLAQAFDVPFSALLATAGRLVTRVLRASEARRLVSPDGRFSSRALYDLSERTRVEFYEIVLAGHSREDAQAHQPGTRENLVVTTGRLELEFGGERFELAQGDAIVFTADVPHAYVNPGYEECTMYLVMTYALAPA